MDRLNNMIIILFLFIFAQILTVKLAIASEININTKAISALCEKNFTIEEKVSGIPKHLLHAISLKETGRWDQKAKKSFVWPWTVTSGKWSHYFESKENAIRAVNHLKTRNIENIDVGCMQINLKYHPNAFKTLDDAFNPKLNIKYGAKYLKELYLQKKSWSQAVSFYHSSNLVRGGKYKRKVITLWGRTRIEAANKKREKVKNLLKTM